MAEYQAEIADVDPADVVYIDETGLAQFLFRPFACSPRGVEVHGKVSGRKFARLGIVTGQMAGRIVSPFEQVLGGAAAALHKGKTVVMGNARFSAAADCWPRFGPVPGIESKASRRSR